VLDLSAVAVLGRPNEENRFIIAEQLREIGVPRL